MESPAVKVSPTHRGMEEVVRYEPGGSLDWRTAAGKLRAGDVVGFYMSHREAGDNLRHGRIQKIPYDLFRYGHVTLLVPDPRRTDTKGDLKLLQVAMRQAVTATEGLDQLADKSWIAYRPPVGSIDVRKLHEFANEVAAKASSPKTAYDYRATFGIQNRGYRPDSSSEIGAKYTCATLIVAGLHYAGYSPATVKHDGWFDLVTPRQVIDSALPD